MGSSTSLPAWHDTGRAARLWIGILTGPIVWAILLEVNYVLAYVACEQQTKWFLHAATLAGFVIVGAAGYVGWRSGPPADRGEGKPPVTPETTESRARWMSLAGVVFSAWFMLVILAMDVPPLVLGHCQ
jgi:hypothetical protein